MRARRPRPVLPTLVAFLAGAVSAAAVEFEVEFPEPVDLRPGAAVISGSSTVGSVESVEKIDDTRDLVGIRIDDEEAGRIVRGSTFLVTGRPGRTRLEHVAIGSDAPAEPGTRFKGCRSISEVWAKQGRVAAEEIRREVNGILDRLPREVDALRESEDWQRLKHDLATLTFEVVRQGGVLSRQVRDELADIVAEMEKVAADVSREEERAEELAPSK